MAKLTINIAIVGDNEGTQYLVFAEPKLIKNHQGKMVNSSDTFNTFFRDVNGGKKQKLSSSLPINVFADRGYFADMFQNVIEWFLPEEVEEEVEEEIDVTEEEEEEVEDLQIKFEF